MPWNNRRSCCCRWRDGQLTLGPWDVKAGWRQREAVELEARRHGATDQRVGTCAARSLPMALGHDDLRSTCQQIRGQHVIRGRAVICCRQAQDQRRACVKQPDFGGIHFVPVTGLTCGQQEIDACTAGSACVVRRPCLAVMTTFGMGAEAEVLNDLLCGHEDRVGCP